MWPLYFACAGSEPVLRLPEGGRGAESGTWILDAPGAPPVVFHGLECAIETGGDHPDVSCVEVLPGTSLRATIPYRWDGVRYRSPLDHWLSIAAPERGLPARAHALDGGTATMEVNPSCAWLVVPVDTLAVSERGTGGWVEGPSRAPVRAAPAAPFEFRHAVNDDRGVRWLGVELDAWVRASCTRPIDSEAPWSE